MLTYKYININIINHNTHNRSILQKNIFCNNDLGENESCTLIGAIVLFCQTLKSERGVNVDNKTKNEEY